MVMRVLIEVVTVVEVDIGLKRLATIPLEIMEQELMFPVEVDIGLRPATLPPITKVTVVDCRVSNFLLFVFSKVLMVMKEVIVLVIMG